MEQGPMFSRMFENITQIWLEGYKWRLLRANGVDEKK
ncbi:glucuronate isomerase [Halobacillus sp. B23F22_1]